MGADSKLFLAALQCCNRVDPFTLKEWYDIKAPSIFQVRNPGKTLVTRTKGTSEFAVCSTTDWLAWWLDDLRLCGEMPVIGHTYQVDTEV